jgi:hypothetical protein
MLDRPSVACLKFLLFIRFPKLSLIVEDEFRLPFSFPLLRFDTSKRTTVRRHLLAVLCFGIRCLRLHSALPDVLFLVDHVALHFLPCFLSDIRPTLNSANQVSPVLLAEGYSCFPTAVSPLRLRACLPNSGEPIFAPLIM